ncbi:MAG: LamG-like jellyroll fold domain-containing protein, partial [Candidatus Moranbacteria bacterium]|nr:LamG-like jellyroll fold domain-containing protein [Candidatus Moranbacteria bacterium]
MKKTNETISQLVFSPNRRSGFLSGSFLISPIKNLIRKKSAKIVSTITLFALVSGIYFASQAQGVDFTFTQADWSGGESAITATHTDNQTDWNRYSSKDPNITATDTVQLSSSTQTANIDFNTEADYIQEDADSGTDFVDGGVMLHHAYISESDVNTKLLLHSNGANNSTDFIDSSYDPKSITVFDNAKIATDQYKFGGASAYFDGAADRLLSPVSTDFVLGTGDFTIDLWARSTDTNGALITSRTSSSYAGAFWLGFVSGYLRYYNGGTPLLSFAGYNDGNWHHIAVTRSSAITTLYVDGVNIGSSADNANYTLNGGVSIGRDPWSANYDFLGYIDEIRFSKGIARWNSNFTPPSSEYNVTPYPLSQPYYVTTSDSSDFDFSNVSQINSISIINSQPANTSIKGLVSFDGRQTWKKAQSYISNPTSLDPSVTTRGVVLSDNNRTISGLYENNGLARGLAGISSGKHYFEMTLLEDNAGASYGTGMGIITGNPTYNAGINDFSYFYGYGILGGTLQKADGSSQNNFVPAPMVSAGQTVGLAIDLDNHTMQFYKNSTTLGTIISINSAMYYPAFIWNDIQKISINFGQSAWVNTPPAGYIGIGDASYTLADFNGNLDNLQSGNTIPELESAFVDYTITDEASLDFAFDLSTTDPAVTPSMDNIDISYSTASQGTLTSSTYDTTVTGSSLSSLHWSETLPANTDILFQLRTSSDGTTWGPWCGPDAGAGCDSDAYFTDPTGESETIDDTQKDHLDDRYFQYQATLISTDGTSTPTLSDVTVSYATVNLPTVTTQ